MEAPLPLTRRVLALCARWRAASPDVRPTLCREAGVGAAGAAALARLEANLDRAEAVRGEGDGRAYIAAACEGLALAARDRAGFLRLLDARTHGEALLWEAALARQVGLLSPESAEGSYTERVVRELAARGYDPRDRLPPGVIATLAYDLGVDGRGIAGALASYRRGRPGRDRIGWRAKAWLAARKAAEAEGRDS